MKVVDLVQGTDRWLDWRREGITATDASVLLNVSPYKTVWRLWAEKTGLLPEVDLSMNPLVRSGIRNEPFARRDYEDQYDELAVPLCVESTAVPYMRASLDGYLLANVPLELKCPSERVFHEVSRLGKLSDAFKLYEPQVQQQIYVTGADYGWLVFWFQGALKEFRIERDDSLIDSVLTEAEHLMDCIRNRVEPPKDPKRDYFVPSDSVEEQLWRRLAEPFVRLDEEARSLKSRLDEIKQEKEPLLDKMKSLMGEFMHADYANVKVTRYLVAGNVDYERLLAGNDSISRKELDKYRSKPSERCRAVVSGSKEMALDQQLCHAVSSRGESCYF